MDVKEFDYELPEELIAQDPLSVRSDSRLLIMDIDTGGVTHRHFRDIKAYLKPGDCLLINDTKVIPARLLGVKEETGAHVEVLLLKRKSDDEWECLVKPGKKLKPGAKVSFGGGLLRAEVMETLEEGNRLLKFSYEGIFEEVLDQLGEMPLPPYITHKLEDKNRYQTVYATHEGSAAAPTAGLHFTKELLSEIEAMGVNIARVTLHVGLGTFRPVKAETLEEHHMHSEYYMISKEAAEAVNKTMEQGGRIISVGTTSTRTVESAAFLNPEYETAEKEAACGNEEAPKEKIPAKHDKTEAEISQNREKTKEEKSFRKEIREGKSVYIDHNGKIIPKYILKETSGWTEIFIYPGYEWKIVDALITNFHLPQSTLVMLVSSLAGREQVLHAYKEAVEKKYRFFSFGDACLFMRGTDGILPDDEESASPSGHSVKEGPSGGHVSQDKG